jgi:hypothetical protein
MTHNHIDRIEARNGAAAVGALHGALTINNIGVPADLAARLARPSPLPEDQALRVVQDLLAFTARNHRYLALRGMGSNVGLPLRLPLVEVFVGLVPRLRLGTPFAGSAGSARPGRQSRRTARRGRASARAQGGT